MSEFDTKQPRIPGYVAMNHDGSFTAVPSIKPEDVELSIAGVAIKSPPQNLLRYCGDQPGDDWVKRVERLNGMIDVMREERGEVVA